MVLDVSSGFGWLNFWQIFGAMRGVLYVLFGAIITIPILLLVAWVLSWNKKAIVIKGGNAVERKARVKKGNGLTRYQILVAPFKTVEVSVPEKAKRPANFGKIWVVKEDDRGYFFAEYDEDISVSISPEDFKRRLEWAAEANLWLDKHFEQKNLIDMLSKASPYLMMLIVVIGIFALLDQLQGIYSGFNKAHVQSSVNYREGSALIAEAIRNFTAVSRADRCKVPIESVPKTLSPG